MTLQKPQDPDRDWWTFENDLTGVMGPRSGPEIIDNLKMFTTHCSFYGPATNQAWVYMSEQLIEAIKSSFMSSSIQTPATRLGRDIARRIQQAGLQTPSLQTNQEDDDEDDYSTENDEKCYDMIVGTISLKQTTGEEMVLAIDEMFGDNPSGYKLYLWLCARGKFDSDQLGTGIIDANATRLEVEQFKIPSGKLTPEVLDTAQRSFVRLFCKQPEGRQGIKGDMTVAWFEKLPKIPFSNRGRTRDAAARLAGLRTSTVRTLHATGAGNQACISRLRATSQPRPARRVAPMETLPRVGASTSPVSA